MKYYYVYILLHKEQLHIHASQWIFLSPAEHPHYSLQALLSKH
ncbi:Uncharacterised protein [Klebsiella pneumoniae]|nr:Uncharacterised protein [Klebsiella pneumoniae]SVX98467.1 Uncharacterised protein [Klebsiella pneumoniae]